MSYSLFWVIPRRLNFMCWHFGTHCSIFIGGVNKKNVHLVHTTYENGTECSETSALKIQTPGNHTKESTEHYSILLLVCPSDFLSFVSDANHFLFAALPWLSGSAAGLSSRSLEFNPSAVHVWFVVDNMALTQFLQVLRFASLTTILPMLHIHSSVPKSL